MAKVLQNFLIGVGLDTDEFNKGAQGVERNLEGIRTTVGFTGKAIAGAFSAMSIMAIGASNRLDALSLAAEGLNTSAQFIYDYGNAIKMMGGNAEEALPAIKNLEERIAQRKNTGKFPGMKELVIATKGKLSEQTMLGADSGMELLREIARIMPSLTQDQQLEVQRLLNLTDGVTRSLRDGVDELDAAVATAHALAGGLGESVEAARGFQEAVAKIGIRFEGIGNTLAEKMLPSFTGILNSFGNFIDTNKGIFSKGIDIAAENPGTATAAAIGAGVAGVGLLKMAGRLVSAFGPAGMAVGGLLTLATAGYELYEQSQGGGAADKAVAPKKEEEKSLWDKAKDSASDLWSGMTDNSPRTSASDEPSGESLSGYSSRGSYEPVYSGGEISNIDAANVNPNVVMLREARRSELSGPKPQPVKIQNHLDVRMELDGRRFDSRVIEVVERRESNTMDDMLSTVNR